MDYSYKIWKQYLEFLCYECRIKSYTYKKYEKLFYILHNIKFTWVLVRDENREADGMDMRADFLEDITVYPICSENEIDWFNNHYCSVMEMLVAFAIRVDNEYVGDPGDPHPEEFFMEMLENMGLLVFTDDHVYEKTINKIVKTWLSRKFKRNGVGSPFPVKEDDRDQRKLEIWNQMNSYISENYVY